MSPKKPHPPLEPHSKVPTPEHKNDPVFKDNDPKKGIGAYAVGGAATADFFGISALAALGPFSVPGVIGLTAAGAGAGALAGFGKYVADSDYEEFDMKKMQKASFQPSQECRHIIAAQHLLAKQLKAACVPMDENEKVDLSNSSNVNRMEAVLEAERKHLKTLIGDRHTNADRREDYIMTDKILAAAQAELPHYGRKMHEIAVKAAEQEKHHLQKSGVTPTSAEASNNLAAHVVKPKGPGKNGV